MQVCYATMARLGWKRRWDAAHETDDGKPMWHDGTHTDWATSYGEDHPFHRDDGVTITVSDRDDGTWDQLLPGLHQGEPQANERHDGGN